MCSSIFLLSLLSISTQFQIQPQFLKQSVHSDKNKKIETVNQIYLNCGNEQVENITKSK